MPKWYCPANKQTYTTHDFATIPLSDGQNYCHFFGIPISSPLSRPDSVPPGLLPKVPAKKLEDAMFETLAENSPTAGSEETSVTAPDALEVFDNLECIQASQWLGASFTNILMVMAYAEAQCMMRPVERSKYISGRMPLWRRQCMNVK